MNIKKRKFYQKLWFKNTVLITVPFTISVAGIILSFFPNLSNTIKTIIAFVIFLLLLFLGFFVIYTSHEEENIYKKYEESLFETENLTKIIAHLENDCNTYKFIITTLSEMSETWSRNLNSFVDNVLRQNKISNRAWDKIKYFDSICLQCKNMILQYCDNKDITKVSVSFVSCWENGNREKIIHMISHSNTESARPNACKKEEKLSQSKYYYAELIKEEYSDIDVAVNNEEIRKRFNKITSHTDLSKYTQYIAIPVYCTSHRLLGIFQIVTKYNYIIESDRVTLIKFATENVLPYSNLIVLVDKINKGLYLTQKEQ